MPKSQGCQKVLHGMAAREQCREGAVGREQYSVKQGFVLVQMQQLRDDLHRITELRCKPWSQRYLLSFAGCSVFLDKLSVFSFFSGAWESGWQLWGSEVH